MPGKSVQNVNSAISRTDSKHSSARRPLYRKHAISGGCHSRAMRSGLSGGFRRRLSGNGGRLLMMRCFTPAPANFRGRNGERPRIIILRVRSRKDNVIKSHVSNENIVKSLSLFLPWCIVPQNRQHCRVTETQGNTNKHVDRTELCLQNCTGSEQGNKRGN
jgi:hypothetical protein